MEELLKQLLEGQKLLFNEIVTIKNEIADIKNEMAVMKNEMAVMKNEMATKTQQDENTQIIKAIIHRTEELDAKFEGLLATTATKDSIARLEAKFDVLNHRLFEQEADIQLLKKAQ